MALRKYEVEFTLNPYSEGFFAIRPADLCEAFLDSKEVKTALSNINIYLICKRARITVDPDTVLIDKETVSAEINIYRHGKAIRRRWSVPTGDPSKEGTLKSSPYPHTYLIQSDHCGEEISRYPISLIVQNKPQFCIKPDSAGIENLEILYIGQSFGFGENGSIIDRLRKHETLQKIVSTVATESPDDEIVVLLVNFSQRQLMMVAVPGDTIEGREKSTQHIKNVLESSLTDERVTSLVEASLIRYFQPMYNKIYRDSFPSTRLQVLQECYALDFCSIGTALETESWMMNLYTQTISANSSHYAHFDLHDETIRKGFFSF